MEVPFLYMKFWTDWYLTINKYIFSPYDVQKQTIFKKCWKRFAQKCYQQQADSADRSADNSWKSRLRLFRTASLEKKNPMAI